MGSPCPALPPDRGTGSLRNWPPAWARARAPGWPVGSRAAESWQKQSEATERSSLGPEPPPPGAPEPLQALVSAPGPPSSTSSCFSSTFKKVFKPEGAGERCQQGAGRSLPNTHPAGVTGPARSRELGGSLSSAWSPLSPWARAPPCTDGLLGCADPSPVSPAAAFSMLPQNVALDRRVSPGARAGPQTPPHQATLGRVRPPQATRPHVPPSARGACATAVVIGRPAAPGVASGAWCSLTSGQRLRTAPRPGKGRWRRG